MIINLIIVNKYTHILQIIAVVIIIFGLIGKVFNCIIFLRKPVYEQINASRLLCVLSRNRDIFVSWSIGFVIFACIVHHITIVHSKCLRQPTSLRVFTLILLTMLLKTTLIDGENRSFTYCTILFGRQMGYFSYGGFQATRESLYDAPLVNFIVSSLIPFVIVALTNIIIIIYVLKVPPKPISTIDLHHNDTLLSKNVQPSDSLRSSFSKLLIQIIKQAGSYETTIILITSCVFLITNSIVSIYIYVNSNHRSNHSRLTEDLKTLKVYRILCMLALFGIVLEFYIYFLIGKKFREEVYQH
ncbi:unnamed protein product [Rotaria sp. Silwood2]|nr:unnamed protein product [Rotaria sp. Silwood2]CAF4274491.1 unnamed protein product [Rotaria sp. Silwood2]